MGIPRFYRQWLEPRNYAGVISQQMPTYVSSLLIDMNAIVHEEAGIIYAYAKESTEEDARRVQATHPAYLEESLFKAITQRILSLLRVTRALEILVMAVDGVAPLAKIQQQRQRRYRTAEERKPNAVFDSNAITPGTDFMIRLDAYLTGWLRESRDKLPPKVIYSSHLVPGEGEHKILDLMREGEIVGNGAHIIHGLDADLIMLSLVAPINSISLMREEYPFERARYKVSYIVNIDNMKTALIADLGLPTATHDFVIMMYLLGNDFLPKVASMEDFAVSLDLMFDVYRAVKMPLSKGDGTREIDWTGMAYFLATLAQYENELLDRLSLHRPKYPSRMMTVATTKYDELGRPQRQPFDYNLFRGAWYSNALGPKGDMSLFDVMGIPNPYPISVERVTEMIQNYLNGLAWVYSYYSNGILDININYIYRYAHAPLLGDVAPLIATPPVLTEYPYSEESPPFNPMHQLLAVLPPKSRKLLPPEIAFLSDINSPIADMFPSTFILERDGQDKDWHGVVILPPVEANRIINAVKPIEGSLDPARINIAETDIRIDATRYAQVTAPGYTPPVRGRGRGRGERGRGTYAPRGRGEGRGTYQPRGGERGRGAYTPRGAPGGGERGRGTYQPRGERGAYTPRGAPGGERGRGTYQPRGERGAYTPRGRGGPGGERGAYTPRGGRGTYTPRGERGAYTPRGRGTYPSPAPAP